jgi:hypothetical protein
MYRETNINDMEIARFIDISKSIIRGGTGKIKVMMMHMIMTANTRSLDLDIAFSVFSLLKNAKILPKNPFI